MASPRFVADFRARLSALWRRRSAPGRGRSRGALLAVGGAFLTAMVLMTLLGEQGLIAYLRMQREAEQLRTEVRELEARQRELTWQVRALREEPGYVELLARQKLGLAKPGETIIQLPLTDEERP